MPDFQQLLDTHTDHTLDTGIVTGTDEVLEEDTKRVDTTIAVEESGKRIELLPIDRPVDETRITFPEVDAHLTEIEEILGESEVED